MTLRRSVDKFCLVFFSSKVIKILKCILYPSKDETRDVRSNLPLRLKEFPRGKPEGTLKGEGVYLTVYPESSPDMDSISFYQS